MFGNIFGVLDLPHCNGQEFILTLLSVILFGNAWRKIKNAGFSHAGKASVVLSLWSQWSIDSFPNYLFVEAFLEVLDAVPEPGKYDL